MSWLNSALGNIEAAANNVGHYATQISGVVSSVSSAASQARQVVNTPGGVSGLITNVNSAAANTASAANTSKYVMYVAMAVGLVLLIMLIRKA